MRTYTLVTRNGRLRVLDEAMTPEKLRYRKVASYTKWGVCVRLKGRLHLIAAVNIGRDDYDHAYAVETVRRELQHGDDHGEFDCDKDADKWPVVSITKYATMMRTGFEEYWDAEDYAI